MSELFPAWALGLMAARQSIASVIAGFSFTMLGFLATIITLLFTLTQSNTLKRYRSRGYLGFFFYLYLLTIFCLLLTSFLALTNFGHEDVDSVLQLWLFRLQLMGFVVCIFQVSVLTCIICNLVRLATHEPSVH